jgi:hypothetical protein
LCAIFHVAKIQQFNKSIIHNVTFIRSILIGRKKGFKARSPNYRARQTDFQIYNDFATELPAVREKEYFSCETFPNRFAKNGWTISSGDRCRRNVTITLAVKNRSKATFGVNNNNKKARRDLTNKRDPKERREKTLNKIACAEAFIVLLFFFGKGAFVESEGMRESQQASQQTTRYVVFHVSSRSLRCVSCVWYTKVKFTRKKRIKL